MVSRILRIGPKTFCIGFPGTSTFRNQCFRVLRDATQLWYTWPQHSCRRFLFFLEGIVVFLWLFVWLFINLVMREQTLVRCFTTRFCFVELTLGLMPKITRRSRASTFQLISARLSKNDPWLLLPRILLVLDTLRHRDTIGSESVFWFLGTIVTLMPETALVSFRTLAFFFPLVISSFNATQSLWIFLPTVSGVTVS